MGVYNSFDGDSIEFRCYFNTGVCLSSESVDWTFGGTAVTDTEGAVVPGIADWRSAVDPITIAVDDNEKDLTCTMAESGASRTLTIIVNVPPPMEDMILMVDGVAYPDGAQLVVHEGPHDFQCSFANARPTPDIAWDFDATQVIEDDGLGLEQPDTLFNYTSYIYDRHIDYEDCFVIVTCTASNYATEVLGLTTAPSTSVQLLVITPPEQYSPWVRLTSGLGIMEGNFEALLVHGESVTFSCWVHKADPDVSIDWTLEQINNGQLTDSSVDAMEVDPDCSDDSQSSLLTFVPNVDEHHEQPLTCRGSNEYYNVTRVVDINVQIPLYTFSRCAYVLSEPELLVFRVERKPNIGDELIEQTTGRVRVDTSPFTASNTFDFESITVDLEFPPGVTFQDVYIHLADNRVPENTEEFTISLLDPQNGRLGDCSETTIIVSDDDVLFSFLVPSVVVLESGGFLNVTVERQGKLDEAVSIGVNVLASPGSDYTSVSRTTLDFAADVSYAYYLLPLVDDNIVEDDEELQLFLSNPSIGYTAGIQEIDVTIVDDDAVITIDAIPTTVTEDGGTISVVATRIGYLQIPQSIYVRTGYFGDSAKADEDYIFQDVKLNFLEGQSVNYDLFVSIRDDNIPEPTEKFLIQIYDGPLESLGEPKQVEITILDDDDGEQPQTNLFSLERDSYTVVESDGVLEVRIYRSGSPSNEGSVVFFTGYHSDGNARAPDDYQDVSKRIQFRAGVSSVMEQIDIVDDDIDESIETFWVGLREPLGGKLGDIISADITLIDDQMSLFSDMDHLFVNEAAGSLRIILKRRGYTGRAVIDVDILPDNQANPGEDFQLPNTIEFPEGVSEIVILLEVVNNEIQENREVVDFRFSGDKIDNDVIIRVEITDDDVDVPETPDNGGLSDLAYILIGLGVALVLILGVVAIICGVICTRCAVFRSHQVHRPRRVMRPSRTKPMQYPRYAYYNRNYRR
ncbi:extracellular matrix organizing protein FRAS1-like [Amphiura filiformis]|uniref:extracellular matrix organizing protein FRAS1-like n=1 Tax=Amphiura filiformis TaxID=82378 RepID=UPI003B218490